MKFKTTMLTSCQHRRKGVMKWGMDSTAWLPLLVVFPVGDLRQLLELVRARLQSRAYYIPYGEHANEVALSIDQ